MHKSNDHCESVVDAGTACGAAFNEAFSSQIAAFRREARAGSTGQRNLPDGSNKSLDLPMNIFSNAVADNSIEPKSSGWVLPIGAHSSKKSGVVPLERIEKPDPSLPDVWNQPEGTMLDGKCGITGVSNMLRLYGIEKDPAKIDLGRYRSVGPGLRAEKFASDMKELTGGKNFTACTIDDEKQNPLFVLKSHIEAGKPVAIMYMNDSTEAHWVVVTGVGNGVYNPEVIVQSGGAYHKTNWRNLQDQWKRGYGGDYPYVVGDEKSLLKRK